MDELIISKKDDLTNIANAVREQTGGTDPLSLTGIANEIRTLSAINIDVDNVLMKTEQELTAEELQQVRKNLRFIGKDVEGQQFVVDGQTLTASANAEIFGDYVNNIAIGQWSIAEGSGTLAKGRASHAEGSYCTMPDKTKRYSTAAGYASHTEGGGCHTTGSCAHAEGLASIASGNQAHAEGRYTIAAGGAQHVEGVANIEDAEGKYIHIAGNGSFEERSNAYTLDWDGNGWFAGTVEATAIYLRSSTEGSNKIFKLTIDDTGTLSITENV